MMYKLSVLFFLFSISVLGYSQNKILTPNYADSISAGIKLHDNKQYNEAVKLYRSVPENDSLYISAVSEQLISYYKNKEYDKGIEIAQNALKRWRHALIPAFYLNYGSCLDMAGKYSEAVKIYDIALLEYPMNYKIYYNKGISLEMMERYDEAFVEFQTAIEINPFHSKSHYRVGSSAFNEGNLTLGILAYNTFLFLEPDSYLSNGILSELNEICSTKIIEKQKSKGVNIIDSEDYSEIDLMVKNYLALDKKYSINSKLTYPAIKQSHLVFQKISEFSKKDEFWYRTYVPFFKRIYEENLFEEYSYYISQSSNSNAHKKIVAKNAAKIVAFAKKGLSIFDDSHREFYLDSEFSHVFRGNGGFAVSTLCNLTDDKENVKGNYTEFYASGNIKSKKQYTDSGLKTGEWKFYNEKGVLVEKDTYKDDVLIDTVYFYSDFGLLKGKYSVKDNKINGKVTYYNSNGVKEQELYIYDEKTQGEIRNFYNNGNLSAVYNVIDGETDGRYVSYYPNGNTYEVLHYKAGKKVGVDTVLHNNGKLYYTADITDGKTNGNVKYFWDNGNLKYDYNIKDDLMIGIQKEYLNNGALESQYTYDEKGKLDGLLKEFYLDGEMFSEIDYQKGDIMAYRFFDKEGKIIEEQNRKKGKFNYTGYYRNGNVMLKGEYGRKYHHGKWEYFTEYGILKSSQEYKRGDLNGESLFYYPNGYLYQKEYSEKDKREGYIYSYTPFKKLYFDGYYKDDLKTGTHRAYYDDGTLEMEAYYVDNKLNGYKNEFCPEGKLYRCTYYENNVVKTIKTYSSTETLIDSIQLNNGNGHIVFHNENGDVTHDYYLKNNQIEGTYFEYYPRKKLKVKTNYLNGEIDGKYETYYTNGQLSSSYSYTNGIKNGKNKDFFYNGNLKFSGTYYMDKIEGKSIWYYKNGDKSREYFSIGGEKNGKQAYYSPDGVISHYRYFEDDAIRAFIFEEKGIEKKIEFNGTEKITLHFENGNISRVMNFKNGWLEDGEYKEYYSTGKIYKQSNYKHDRPDGEYLTYFENGNIYIKTTYAYGDKYGEELVYFPNGKIQFKKNYRNGYLHGKFEEYSVGGKLIRSYIYRYSDVIKKIK